MAMIGKSPDIFWTKETTKGLSFVPGVDLVPSHKAMKVTSNFKPLPKLPKKHLAKVRHCQAFKFIFRKKWKIRLRIEGNSLKMDFFFAEF